MSACNLKHRLNSLEPGFLQVRRYTFVDNPLSSWLRSYISFRCLQHFHFFTKSLQPSPLSMQSFNLWSKVRSTSITVVQRDLELLLFHKVPNSTHVITYYHPLSFNASFMGTVKSIFRGFSKG